MENQDLKITIKAFDEASQVLKQITEELKKNSDGMDKAKKSSEGMATSFVKGAAAYELLKKSATLAIGFFKSSIEESMNAAQTMAQVETNVKNAGFAFDQLSPKIREAGDAAVKLGFDDEDAALGVSKFLLVTKNSQQALALHNLTMDVAAGLGKDYSEAQSVVAMAVQGNIRELKKYGVQGETTAEVLINAQEKFKNSAITAADTSAGRLRSLTQEYTNLKQGIGDELMPEVIDFLNILQSNKETITAFADGFIFLGKAVGFVAKGFVGFGKLVATGISGMAEKATADLSTVTWGLNQMGWVSDETVKKTDNLALSWKETTKAAADDTLNLYNDVPKLTNSIDDISEALGGVKDSTGGMQELTDIVNKAKTTYKDFADSVKEELINLEDDHNKATDSFKNDIDGVKKSLKELASTYKNDLADALKSYNDATKNNTKSVAESIVANEDAIASIKEKLAGGGLNSKEKTALQSELDARLKSEEDNAGLIQSLSSQVAAVKEYNSMSDLERAVYDYEQKKVLAQQEYDETVSNIKSVYKEKKLALDKELSDIRDKQEDERSLYQQKVDFINGKNEEALKINTEYANSNLSITKTQVQSEIDYYEQLAAAIKAARSASTGSFANIKSKVAAIPDSIKSHEHGGTVIGPIGTAVPIIAHGGEKIIPASQRGSDGNNIVVNLYNPEIKNKDDIQEIKKQVETVFRDIIRTNKVPF